MPQNPFSKKPTEKVDPQLQLLQLRFGQDNVWPQNFTFLATILYIHYVY